MPPPAPGFPSYPRCRRGGCPRPPPDFPPLAPLEQIPAGPGRLGPASAARPRHGLRGGCALILMGVIMIGPPKSEKGTKAPHRGDATAAGTCRQAQPSFPAAATISTFRSRACRIARARRSSASLVGILCPPLMLLTCAPASTAWSRAQGEIQLREVPLLIGEDRDNQPATLRRQPGDRAVVAPEDHAGHVGAVPAHPPAGRPAAGQGGERRQVRPRKAGMVQGRPARRAPPRKGGACYAFP